MTASVAEGLTPFVGCLAPIAAALLVLFALAVQYGVSGAIYAFGTVAVMLGAVVFIFLTATATEFAYDAWLAP